MTKPQHVPRFDWEQARRLASEGMTHADIAKRLGVSTSAVWRVVDPKRQARLNVQRGEQQSIRRLWVGECKDCGGPASTRFGQHERCIPCSALHRSTSVREDTLRCSTCRLWLPDDEFPRAVDNKSRRGRHALCRPCQNVARQLNRESNRERERTYSRERRRSIRAAAREGSA